MNSTTFLKTSASYNKLGFSTIPILPVSKIPAVKWQEFQKRIATPQEQQKWTYLNHSLNIGIATGRLSRFVAVDVEKGGKIDDFPKTVCAKTGGGGYHFYYKHPGLPVKNTTRIREKTDIRGDGGYVVAPPSQHPSGGSYEWKKSPFDTPLADLPDFIIKLLEKQNNKRENLMDPVIEGERNSTIFRRSIKLKALGKTFEEALAECLKIKDIPQLSPDEIKRTVESAYSDRYKVTPPAKEAKVEYTSFIVADGIIYEQVYDEKTQTSVFAKFDKNTVSIVESFSYLNKIWKPFSNKIVFDKVVKFPSHPAAYKNAQELYQEIRAFIHTYVDIPEIYEKLTAYYVLFTWVFDKLPVCPYLAAIGPSNTGKTRLTDVVGAICYKPFQTSGSISAASVFRIVDQFKGTLILNEFDHVGQFNSEIVVVFNNGYEPGHPAVRVEGDQKKHTVTYQTWCPKILSARKRKSDWAFESRLISVSMRKTKRTDIPTFLLEDFNKKAMELKNKLLMFRFRSYFNPVRFHDELFKNISGRLRQTLLALSAIIQDKEFLQELDSFATELNNDLKQTQELDIEAVTYQALQSCWSDRNERPQLKEITAKVRESMGTEKITPKAVGQVIRDELGMATRRMGGGYVVMIQKSILDDLSEVYEIEGDAQTAVNNSKNELSEFDEPENRTK